MKAWYFHPSPNMPENVVGWLSPIARLRSLPHSPSPAWKGRKMERYWEGGIRRGEGRWWKMSCLFGALDLHSLTSVVSATQ